MIRKSQTTGGWWAEPPARLFVGQIVRVLESRWPPPSSRNRSTASQSSRPSSTACGHVPDVVEPGPEEIALPAVPTHSRLQRESLRRLSGNRESRLEAAPNCKITGPVEWPVLRILRRADLGGSKGSI